MCVCGYNTATAARVPTLNTLQGSLIFDLMNWEWIWDLSKEWKTGYLEICILSIRMGGWVMRKRKGCICKENYAVCFLN